MENSELIPFGKYKGQPVEVLASDPNYVEWLIQQPGFTTRNPKLYQIIINNFAEPNETPEHNAMQAKFLDTDWCRKFLTALGVERFLPVYKKIEMTLEEKVAAGFYNRHSVQHKNGPTENWTERSIECVFESKGIDVTLTHGKSYVYWIELKPVVGDDYPSILRSIDRVMDRRNSNIRMILVVGQFSSQAVTEDQFRAIFKASGIQVIFTREIEAAVIQPAPLLEGGE